MPRGRPREFDRDEALRSAMLLFWRKGFHATSIANLCDALQLTTPSLYAAFGNKEKLYIEAVQLYLKNFETTFTAALSKGRTYRSGMRDLLRSLARELTCKDSHPLGCFVTLATVDEDMPAAVATTIRHGRKGWLDLIHAHVQKAVAEEELARSTDVDALSRSLNAILQSIGIQSHDGATQSELEAMVETSMTVWPKAPIRAAPKKAVQARST